MAPVLAFIDANTAKDRLHNTAKHWLQKFRLKKTLCTNLQVTHLNFPALLPPHLISLFAFFFFNTTSHKLPTQIMDIRKLLNPVPNKKPRFDEDILVCDRYWLPTELIAYIMTFFHYHFRPPFRLVSKKWYTAYDLYHRNRVFADEDHVFDKNVTRNQVLSAFVKYGYRLHWMYNCTSMLREILEIEPNFADLIPNVIRLYVTIDDSFPTQRWMSDFVMKLGKLNRITIQEYGFTADEHLAGELDKAVATMPCLDSVLMFDIDLDFNAFPGPNTKERANQIRHLKLSVVNIEPGLVVSTFTMFKNARRLGLSGISSVNVLKEVTEMVTGEKNFPAMNTLEVHSQLDLSHASPIIDEEDGTTITAMDLYLKICGIRRRQLELHVGFILGACSKTNSVLIEKERDFVINVGKTGADIIAELDITHHTPVGDYDPLTTLLYESAPCYSNLKYLALYVSPTAATGPRIIEALNNSFLLPHLIQVNFYVDGTQSPEWNYKYDPTHPSRGLKFVIGETQHEDEARMVNENNDGILPSWFKAD
ncbi:hypothetical protein GQ42DRAFT_22812 [Ramicandelaber brevisporus]|nr:hypothetical protein GQ42DRAFT_22812 [Ramicandelaber brevisporus]